jgi:carbamoylphosphate synthase large subunit
MHKELEKNNISHIKQYKFTLGVDNIELYRDFALSYPCFVKPLSGIGSYGAKKINSFSELVEFFTNMDISQLNKDLSIMLKEVNPIEYLICEYIEGEEYMVDTFSYQGKHCLSLIQKPIKKNINGKPTYRYCEVVKEQDLITKIMDYVSKVLDALGLHNGFADTEIFFNPNTNNLVFIELNPRISGLRGIMNQIATCEGYPNQVELLYKAIKQQLLTNLNELNHKPVRSKWMILFNLNNNPVPDYNHVLAKYGTCKIIHQLKPSNSMVNNTSVAISDASAFVLCYSNNIEQLNRECEEILFHDENGWDV